MHLPSFRIVPAPCTWAALGSALALALVLPACASTTRARAIAPGATVSGPVLREDLRAEAGVQTPTQPSTPPAKAAGNDDPDLAIAMVAGEAIDVRSFLARTWIRSSDVSREILDRLVVERLALIEAERQEIAVTQTQVDERLETAWKALGDSLARQGRGTSIAEHLRTKLGVDTEYYRRQLRRESIAQLVAERVVRTWSASRERCIVRLVELADKDAAAAFSAGLAAGRDFDSLAKELHRFRDKEPDGARLMLVRNDDVELSSAAFATAEGQVGGPLPSDDGRALMFLVEKRLAPLSGKWKDIAPEIEQGLLDFPVDDLEFVQWRAEMVKSYSVDLDPFFRLIGVSR